MNRREFIKSGSVAAAAVTAGAAVATPDQASASSETTTQSNAIRLRISSVGNEGLNGIDDLRRRVMDQIITLSAGTIDFDVSPTSTLEPNTPDQQLSKLETGDCDIAFGCEQDHVAKHPAFAYFAGLPGQNGLDANAFQNWLQTAGGQSLWSDLAGEFGYHPIAFAHLGPQPPLWSNHEIKDLNDLKGRTISVSGLLASVAEGLGARPVQPINPGEAAASPAAPANRAAAGQTAEIIETGGLYQAMQADAHRSARFATNTGLSLTGTTLTLRIANRVWESLGEAQQAIVTAAASQIYTASVTEAWMMEPGIKKALQAHHGISFTDLSPEARDNIEDVSRAVIAHAAGSDHRGRAVDASFMAFRALSTGAPVA